VWDGKVSAMKRRTDAGRIKSKRVRVKKRDV
jgi:hypothetical protein